MVPYCREGGVGDDGGKGMGFKAHHEKEQQLAGDGMGMVVVCKLHVGDHFGP